MIGLISINHHNAQVDERSAFALSPSEASMLAEDWIECNLLDGIVILSTCNRVELYYTSETTTPDTVERLLIESLLCNLELSPRYAQLIEKRQDEAVYRHLFRLASGLDSMVVGETQILGQIKEAYRMASVSGHCPGGLSRLFHRSFEVAKRIRSEYMLSSTPLSAGMAAVEQALEHRAELGKTLIIGAGIMADTIYEHLRRHSVAEITVYNRTRERAERFAQEHPGARIAYESELSQALREADTILVATSAQTPIVLKEHLALSSKEQVVVDLAVPRNVSPEVDSLSHVKLITIDDLSGLGLQLGAQSIGEIDAIIEEYVEAHSRWVNGAQLREVIAQIHEASKLLLEKELAHLPKHLSDEEQALIKDYDQHLTTTLTTALISTLVELSEEGSKQKYSNVVGDIFSHIIKKHS